MLNLYFLLDWLDVKLPLDEGTLVEGFNWGKGKPNVNMSETFPI